MRSIKHQLHNPGFGSITGFVIAIGVGLFFFFSIFGEYLERISFDAPFMLFRGDGKSEEVVIIALEDASYGALGQNRFVFDGAVHAKLVRRLKAEGAGAIVFDIMFVDRNPPPPGDDELAVAMKKHGGVVIAGNIVREKIDGAVTERPIELRSALQEAAAGWGIARLNSEADFSVRRHYVGEERVPSLPWKAAEIANIANDRFSTARSGDRWLNYYGSRPIRIIPYHLAIDPAYKFPISLKGKTVFVGRADETGYAGDQKDQFKYPWTPLNGYAPFGIEFHALTFANLARGDWLKRFPALLEIVVLLLIGGAAGFGLPRLRPVTATSAGILLAGMIGAVACLSQLRWNVWFSWMIPVAAQIPVAIMWAILFHAIRAHFEAEFLTRSLALYLSPAQVKRILAEPELLKPGVEQREVSILFSDIANFSKISERMLPEDLARLLNDYYETTISAVHETEGTVMNLIGDAILAIWNAPQGQADHRERACRAARTLANKLVSFDSSRPNLRLQTRVGLHTGFVSVGNIGSTSHFDYTVIGENVNLASRLEGLNKYLGTSILATREIQKEVEQLCPTRFVGHFRFKGFDQVVEVHEILVLAPDGGSDWRDRFGKGLHCFQRMAFTEASAHFREVIDRRKTDGPSAFYLEKIREFQAQPPKADWMGEVDLSDK